MGPRRRTAERPADIPGPWIYALSPPAPGLRRFRAAADAHPHPWWTDAADPGTATPPVHRPDAPMPAAGARQDAGNRSTGVRRRRLRPAAGTGRRNPRSEERRV